MYYCVNSVSSFFGNFADHFQLALSLLALFFSTIIVNCWIENFGILKMYIPNFLGEKMANFLYEFFLKIKTWSVHV
jgi:hypothetical protein